MSFRANLNRFASHQSLRFVPGGNRPRLSARCHSPRPGHPWPPSGWARPPRSHDCYHGARSGVRFSRANLNRFASHQSLRFVPGGRIELPWIAPHDFESCASTNSAIPACSSVFKNSFPAPDLRYFSRLRASLRVLYTSTRSSLKGAYGFVVIFLPRLCCEIRLFTLAVSPT